MTYTIEVTQEDINKGDKKECRTCPVARAIMRSTGFTCWVGVMDVLICKSKTNETNVDLPIDVRVFIRTFDQGNPVSPFTFNLEIP